MSSVPSVQELVITSATWLSIVSAQALSRPLMQSGAPTKTTLAPGAIACTASTSRVSSPYQPWGSHTSGLVEAVRGGTIWENWPGLNSGWWCTLLYFWASW